MHPRRLALVAQLGALAFLLCLLILHALTLRALPWYMSEYANSPYRALFIGGGYAFVLAIASAALSLRRTLARSRYVLVALALLALVLPFAFLVATFPVDDGDGPSTLAGQVHDWSTIPMFLFLNAAMLVLWPALRRRPETRGLANLTLTTGLLSALAEAAYLVARLQDVALVGIAQRVLVATVLAWFLGIAFALRRWPVQAAEAEPAPEEAQSTVRP